MNVVRKLSGVVAEEAVGELRCVMALHDQPKPGFIRQVSFGPDGLLLLCGTGQLLIPLGEIFAVAEASDQRFVPPEADAVATSPRKARGGKA